MRAAWIGSVALLVAFGVYAQEWTEVGGVNRTKSITLYEDLTARNFQVVTSTDLYVDPVIGNDTYACKYATPCATIQRACNLVANDVCDTVNIWVDAGYSGAGCYMVGKRQCAHSLSDAGVALGSIRIHGNLVAYDPADAGTGTGFVDSVAAGSSCTETVYTIDAGASGGGYNVNELIGYLIEFTSGTANDGQAWPIISNTVDTITIAGIRPTQPSTNDTYAVRRWGTVINAALGQSITQPGPPAQTARSASFFVQSELPLTDGTSTAPLVSIERMNFVAGANTAVIAQGSIALRENLYSTGTGLRMMPGSATITAERNSIIGTGTVFLAGNTAIGSDVALAQFYNNFAADSGVFFGAGNVATLDMKFNTLTSQGNGEAIRLAYVGDGNSACDTFTGFTACFRSPLSLSTLGNGGHMNFDGLTCSDVGRAGNTLASIGGSMHLTLDLNGPASTITSTQHIAALAQGAHMSWPSTTSFAGAGQNFQLTDTIRNLDLVTVQALTPAAFCTVRGTCLWQTGASEELVSHVISHSNDPKAEESDAGVSASNVLSVTFSIPFRAIQIGRAHV